MKSLGNIPLPPICIKLCFPEELSHIQKTMCGVTLQNIPEVLGFYKCRGLSVSNCLKCVVSSMDQEKLKMLASEGERRTNGCYEAETAAKKALYRGGAELTAVGAPWRQ